MWDDLFKYINNKFHHKFEVISCGKDPVEFIFNDNSVDNFVYNCKDCNTTYYTYNFHEERDFDGGIELDRIYYEMYRSIDKNDLDYITYLDLLTCKEQTVKNLLE